MGAEANVRRDRTCRRCNKSFRVTSLGLRDHDRECRERLDLERRLANIGLVVPNEGLIEP